MKKRLCKDNLSLVSLAVKKAHIDAAGPHYGIVHIGIGAFHRAHQAVFTDDLNQAGSTQWQITGVSLRSANIKQTLVGQDYLYSVFSRDNQTEDSRIISAVKEVLVAPENPQKVINTIASAHTQVVTLTVTEKGYCRDKSGQSLDLNHPDVLHDLQHLDCPKTMPAILVAACKQRQVSQQKLTIISCDNIPANGELTRNIVMAFAQQIDVKLAQWIDKNVHFCSSMVDRIVPAVTPEAIDYATEVLGVEDKGVLITEPFKQWVIEDNFAAEKPAWNTVGVLYVEDVSAYEEMKLRLLNGAHSTLAYVGFLLGYEYIHQAIANPLCLALVQQLHTSLITSLKPIEGIELADYVNVVIERFSNEKVPYKTLQVASDGSQKLSQRLLQPLEQLLQQQQMPKSIAFVMACWCRYLEATDSQGNPVNIIDPMASSLSDIAQQHSQHERQQVTLILQESKVCSKAVLEHNEFIDLVSIYLRQIHQQGVQATLAQLLANTQLD